MLEEENQRPTIIKHQSGLENKVGRTKAIKTISKIDGHSIEDIVKKFGSPVFVFSENTIRENYQNVFQSFSMRYPDVQFAWSYKTNYLDAVCKIFHDLGSIAEVVSEYEYEMARKNNIPGNQIIYNGPYKPDEFLNQAVNDGAKIHVDHYDELCVLETIAKQKNKKIDIGIRLNMDTGIYPQWDRFGFNYDNGEAMVAAGRIAAGGKLNLTGIHAHIGTFIPDPSAYAMEVKKMLQFIQKVEDEFGFIIDYIDIGGGFPSKSTHHGQHSKGEDSIPSIDSYAKTITSTLLSHKFKNRSFPKLILESGRAMIDSAGYMITSVVANKRLADGTRAVIVDTGVTTLITSFWYKHEIYPVKPCSGISEETVIYGPLCMNIDIVRPSLKLPALNKNDLLVIAPVGAYNVTQWLQFIRMRPCVVMTGSSGEISIIRDKEELDAIKRYEHLPEWLNQSNSERKKNLIKKQH